MSKRISEGKRKAVSDFMLLFLVVGIVAAIIVFWSYFAFVSKVVNIKGQVNVFMVNDDAGTELVSLLNSKNSSAKHIELLGSYLGEYSDIEPVKSTLVAFGNYDFTYSGIGSLNFKYGVPPAIIDSNKPSILGCGITTGDQISIRWPLDATYNYITSGFGGRELKQGQCDCHGGIDIQAPVGTNVYAAADGVVYSIEAGCLESSGKACNGGYGNYVVIEHSFNRNKYYTHYAHLQSVNSLKKDDEIVGGALIGTSGNTGYSEAPHLHFELRASGNRPDKDSINPCSFFKNIQAFQITGLSCEHEKVAVCSYVSGMISGKPVRNYDSDIPLPGARSGNVKSTVVFKQWN